MKSLNLPPLKKTSLVAIDFFKLGFLLTVLFYLCLCFLTIWYGMIHLNLDEGQNQNVVGNLLEDRPAYEDVV